MLVRSVLDGDTIDVSSIGHVRLLGVDAPELGRQYDTPAPFAREARERLASLVLKHWVRLEWDGPTRDVYNRHLAYVVREDGLFVNAALVREGLARVTARLPLGRLDELNRAEHEAQAFRRRMVAPRPLFHSRVILPSTGKRSPSATTKKPRTTRSKQDRAAKHRASDSRRYASERKIRERNKRLPVQPLADLIFVFFIAPGPLTLDLFERGFDSAWRCGWRRCLSARHRWTAWSLLGVEPNRYIIRFTEDRPNPLYRRVCYLCVERSGHLRGAERDGSGGAIATDGWRLKMSQLYRTAYFPLAGAIWLLGALGRLPRVKASTRGEHERRYFYGPVWAVVSAARVVADVEGPAGHPSC